MQFMPFDHHLIPDRHYLVALVYSERRAYGQIEADIVKLGGEAWIISENALIQGTKTYYIYSGYFEAGSATITPEQIKVSSMALYVGVADAPVSAFEEFKLDGADWVMGTTESSPIRFLSFDAVLAPKTFYIVIVGKRQDNISMGIATINSLLNKIGMRVASPDFIMSKGSYLQFVLYTEDAAVTPAIIAQTLGVHAVAVVSEPLASGSGAIIYLKTEKVADVIGSTADGVLNTVETIVDVLPGDPSDGINWLQMGIGATLILGLGYMGVKYWTAIQKIRE